MAVSGLIQDKPMKKHKLSSTFCSFTPCSPLLSFLLSNEATVDQSLSFLQRHSRRLRVILIALLTLVLLHSYSRLWDCPRHCDVGLISGIAALSLCSRSRHLAVSIVTLLSAPLPCFPLSHSLAVGLIALQSVSSPRCQPPRLAVGRLEICLTALQSAPLPCSRPRHLAVGPITLQLLILSLITRHTIKTGSPQWLSALILLLQKAHSKTIDSVSFVFMHVEKVQTFLENKLFWFVNFLQLDYKTSFVYLAASESLPLKVNT